MTGRTTASKKTDTIAAQGAEMMKIATSRRHRTDSPKRRVKQYSNSRHMADSERRTGSKLRVDNIHYDLTEDDMRVSGAYVMS